MLDIYIVNKRLFPWEQAATVELDAFGENSLVIALQAEKLSLLPVEVNQREDYPIFTYRNHATGRNHRIHNTKLVNLPESCLFYNIEADGTFLRATVLDSAPEPYNKYSGMFLMSSVYDVVESGGGEETARVLYIGRLGEAPLSEDETLMQLSAKLSRVPGATLKVLVLNFNSGLEATFAHDILTNWFGPEHNPDIPPLRRGDFWEYGGARILLDLYFEKNRKTLYLQSGLAGTTARRTVLTCLFDNPVGTHGAATLYAEELFEDL